MKAIYIFHTIEQNLLILLKESYIIQE